MSTSDRNVLDYEEVMHVLSESNPDLSKEDPDVLVYLSDLGSHGLLRLTQEPERLAEEKVSILEQTQDLAFHNYKTFIQAAECSQKIFRDFSIIESRLGLLVNKLPVFKQKCCEFGKEAQNINTRWKQTSLTLAKHQQLLEFLEMPQLMDNYVKAGYYDEALELSSYVKRLERKHLDISLIRSIIADIQTAVSTMLVQLLAKLQTNIQLPECLKIVGYLRRMDVFNETELRIKFLQARDTWFKKVIDDIDKSDPYQHVIKIIENSRIHLFDIITQYRAIFSDDDPMLLVHEKSKNNCAIFHSWMTMKISWFLHILDNDISSNLGGRIDSVFAQCMYFGLSFSRVSIDFRPLLIPVFENAVFCRFQNELELASQKFEKIMTNYVFSSYSNSALLVPAVSEDSLQPSNNLLDFNPLAQYCNDVLSAFNNLKLCCSFSVSVDIVNVLTTSLHSVVKIVLETYYKNESNMTEEESISFIRFCSMLSSELIPHFNRCLSMLFPSESISQVLGITSMEFKKFEHLCKLKCEEIMKPLEIVLPTKDNDEEDEGLIIEFKNKDTVEEQNISSLHYGISDRYAVSLNLIDSKCSELNNEVAITNNEIGHTFSNNIIMREKNNQHYVASDAYRLQEKPEDFSFETN